MSKVKIRSIIILAFALIAAILLGVVLMTPLRGGRADAIDYATTTIFSEGSGGTVGVSENEGTAEAESRFLQFTFHNDGNVYYRRDLALKWRVATEDTQGKPASEDAYFSMTFAFAPTVPEEIRVENQTKYSCPRCGATLDSVNDECSTCHFSTEQVIFFDRYEISFDSAEENISKAAKSTNSIVFAPDPENEGGLRVGVKNAEAHAAEKDKDDDAEETDKFAGVVFAEDKIAAADVAKNITIALGEGTNPGEFSVTVSVGETSIELSNFTNIGGNYLEYRSSASSTPSTPISFHTELAAAPTAPEGTTYKRVDQCVRMRELNGQTFELKKSGDNYRVEDDADAVLVLNEELYGFSLGQKYSITWKAIDVCDSSVDSNGEYCMLSADKDNAGKYVVPTDDDYKKLTTSVYFMPTDDGGAQETQYVSIRYRLEDGRFTSDEKDKYGYVYLSWYLAGTEKTVDGVDAENTEKAIPAIPVVNNDNREAPIGPYYVGLTANDTDKGNKDDATLTGAVEAYNKALKDVAANEKTSAGNGAYIYLPSFRGLIASNYADYRNLRFTISYKKENSSTSASTESSLRYNNLRFEIDLEGHYAFKVFASDAAGNAMKYYVDGELVDVTTSNIWDIDKIPTFEFDVAYNGADVTEPGEQDPASRGTSFTFEDFEIIDLGSNIKEYTLYYFNTEKLPADTQAPGYSEFVENAKQYAEDSFKDCLVEIKEYNEDIAEGDEEWADTDNDHHWNPDSSLSFVPQRSGYYVLKMTYYDLSKPVGGTPEAQNYYEVVEVRNPYDYIPAKSDWLENNVTSVVLFSISGVLAIAIVVLFVVKPADKTVEEVDLGSLKGKKNKKEKPKK